MAEPQIEVRTEYPYVNIRKLIFRDTRISPQTKYVLILMLSLPPDWDYSVRGLAKIAHVSKDTMSKMVQKLEDAGYLIRKPQPHTDKGHFGKTCYILTDVPVIGKEEDEPCPNLPDTVPPDTVPPDTENSPQVNNKQINNKQQNTPPTPQRGKGARRRKEPRAAPDWKPDRFDGFWKFYPQQGRKNRQDAMDAWDKLRPDDDLIARIGRALVKLKATEEWRRGIGIPYVATFLRNTRWADADELDAPDDTSGNGWADDEEVL